MRDGRQDEGVGLRGQGIAGDRLLEFGHRTEGPGAQVGHGFLALALQEEELAEALRDRAGGVEHGGVRGHGAGVDAEDGQAAGVGVGHGLEHLGRQGAVGVRFQGHFRLSGGVDALDRLPVLRGGEI
jgi:hypothetical protein